MRIYIYLYRVNGVPVYVGQAVNVERRDREHSKGTTRFDLFLKTQEKETVSLEVLESVDDVPHGALANQQEDLAMDQHGTYYPESGRGYNFIRASHFGSFTADQIAANYAALSAAFKGKPLTAEHKKKLSVAQRIRKRKPCSSETRAKISAAQKGIRRKPLSLEHRTKVAVARRAFFAKSPIEREKQSIRAKNQWAARREGR